MFPWRRWTCSCLGVCWVSSVVDVVAKLMKKDEKRNKLYINHLAVKVGFYDEAGRVVGMADCNVWLRGRPGKCYIINILFVQYRSTLIVLCYTFLMKQLGVMLLLIATITSHLFSKKSSFIPKEEWKIYALVRLYFLQSSLLCQELSQYITKTCLYNFDSLKPHFYTVKLGFTGAYIIFHIFVQNIDCGYSLEPPRWGGSNEYPQSMF